MSDKTRRIEITPADHDGQAGELVEFLRARLTEDEQTACAATPGPWWYHPGKMWLGPTAFEHYDMRRAEEFVGYGGPAPFTGCIASTGPAGHSQNSADATHIARHDPARALRRTAVMRRTLDRHQPHTLGSCRVCGRAWPCPDIADLASIWSDHPDYQQEWAA